MLIMVMKYYYERTRQSSEDSSDGHDACTATNAHARDVRKTHVLGVADYGSDVCGTALMDPVSILIFHGGSSNRTQWSRL